MEDQNPLYVVKWDNTHKATGGFWGCPRLSQVMGTRTLSWGHGLVSSQLGTGCCQWPDAPSSLQER